MWGVEAFLGLQLRKIRFEVITLLLEEQMQNGAAHSPVHQEGYPMMGAGLRGEVLPGFATLGDSMIILNILRKIKKEQTPQLSAKLQ
jgi:hypothetical protein